MFKYDIEVAKYFLILHYYIPYINNTTIITTTTITSITHTKNEIFDSGLSLPSSNNS